MFSLLATLLNLWLGEIKEAPLLMSVKIMLMISMVEFVWIL